MKDIECQEQFFISPAHVTLEVNRLSTMHIKLINNFKSELQITNVCIASAFCEVD